MGHNFEHMPIFDSPLPKHYDPATKEFVFVDGSRGHFDAIIYCTGYKHSFPFLSGELDLKTRNRLVPDTLWKGTVRVFGRNLHSRMPLDPTHVRLKRTCV
jgi:hypothetical protein